MKKETKVVPDKIIDLKYGDQVKIYATKDKLTFSVFCDGTGNVFELTKKELEELMK